MLSLFNTTTILTSTSTTTPSLDSTTLIVDYVLLFACCILYGIAFVPVKHFETGDGLYFQFMFAIGIWVAGVPMLLIRNFPEFYMVAFLGGFVWSVGNLCTVPVIRLIGIGVGSLFWNMFGLVWGWAHARYGWLIEFSCFSICYLFTKIVFYFLSFPGLV
jgi:hypothetical protein